MSIEQGETIVVVILILVALMLIGTINNAHKGGEKEGICKYGYLEEEQNNEEE